MTAPATQHPCAGCGERTRPTGYVLCRACWKRTPEALKSAFRSSITRDSRIKAARQIILHHSPHVIQ